MINIDVQDYATFVAFWLVFTRISAILVQLPLFDNGAVPMMVKVVSSLFVSFAFFPYVSAEVLKDVQYAGIQNFWLLTIHSTCVGVAIGLFVKVIMGMFTMAGSMITQQIGFGAIHYFDQSADQQIGPFEKLIQWTILILLLSSGALFPMFKGMIGSFFSIHFYDLGKLAHSPEFFLMFSKSIIFAGLMLAGPIILLNMMISAMLGIMARMVPQLNVIMVSFVVNIGLGLIVFASIADEFFYVGLQAYTKELANWFQFLS